MTELTICLFTGTFDEKKDPKAIYSTETFLKVPPTIRDFSGTNILCRSAERQK